MKVLVTGGAGFIGANFIHWVLKNRDWDIINLDKLTYAGNLESLKSLEDNSRYEFVQGDICDPKLVNDLMSKVDYVVHFAAESHVDRSVLEPGVFIQTNVVGTQVMLQAALENKIKRFHHVSTDEVYGALGLDGGKKFDENTPYDPHSPYSASKASSDHLVRAYGDTFDLEYTITNCSNNYGPYQFPEKMIPLFVANAREDKPLPIYGDGEYIRDYLYVDDHCEAIALVLEKGKSQETYCVGGDSERSINQMAETILKSLEKPESLMTFVKDRPGHDRRYAIDHSKITKELGWKPRVTFDEGIEKTIKWNLDNADWIQNILSGEYQKYYEKQYGERL
ncbi:MAG: dTDP-glucose 4,6-dehydratase [bacterium]|nr:dTDP-glucose 4,6-dehydratase [bacterium]